MKRIMLTIAYDGTAYFGWQKQEGMPTVEQRVMDAIGKLTGESVELIGASRTDAGVHALGNVAVFDTNATIPGERYTPALNSFLPEDIRVMASKETEAEFHPRFDAHSKRYEYHIITGPVANPLETRYAHYVREKLDVEAMKRMAEDFVGEHDFTSFCAAGAQVKSKVRTVNLAEVTEQNGHIVIAVEGDGFLYNMIRIFAGTLLAAGLHRIDAGSMPDILSAKDRSFAGPTAPACGLRLCFIRYK